VAGAVLLSGALVCLLLAISQGRALGWGPAVTLAALVVGVAMFGGITLVPQLIQTGFGFSATQVGLMMLPVAATMLVASPLAARIGRLRARVRLGRQPRRQRRGAAPDRGGHGRQHHPAGRSARSSPYPGEASHRHGVIRSASSNV
jgi:hypothetical protein